MNKKIAKLILLILANAMLLTGCAWKAALPKDTSSATDNPTPEVDASSITSDTDKTASASEPADEPKIDERPVGIVNNNSYFVGVDGKVYFRTPGFDGMRECAIDGEFIDYWRSSCGDLYSYDIDSGKVNLLRVDKLARGPMSVCDDTIYYSGQSTGQEYGLKDCLNEQNIAGNIYDEDKQSFEDEIYCTGSEDGKFFVSYSYDEDSYVCVLRIRSEASKEIQTYRISELCCGIGVAGDSFVYSGIKEADGWDETVNLYSLNLNSLKVTDLGILPGPDGGSGVGVVEQFECDGTGNIALTYCYYDDSVDNINLCYAVTANINTSDSLSFAELKAQDSVPVIALDPNAAGYILVDGKPLSAGFKDQHIGYYDIAGSFVPLMEAQEWRENEYSDEVISYEQCEYLYDAVYAIKNYLRRYPLGDVGWRKSYIRNRCEIVRIDAKTGQEELILFVNAPAHETHPADINQILGGWTLAYNSVEGSAYEEVPEEEYEYLSFNDNWTVSYERQMNDEIINISELELDSSDSFCPCFSFEDTYGPTYFEIIGFNPLWQLEVSIQFTNPDGSTGSRVGLYNKGIY